MIVPATKQTNIRGLVIPVLEARFGVSIADQLTSHERLQAYEQVKKRLRITARGPQDLELKLKRLAAFLEI